MKLIIRKAQISDIEDIYTILLPYSKERIILERSREDIEKNIAYFIIAVLNNNVAGVISYYKYSHELNEIRSLAVKKNLYKKGIGIALLKAMINELFSVFPNPRIFALSYLPEFFKKAGFIEILKDTLPEKIWKDCNKCQNRGDCDETALIFIK